MIKKIDEGVISKNLEKASNGGRKRSIVCLHEKDDFLQRMVNTCLSDTYVRPHKHESPDKLEIFVVLEGKIALFIFDESGKIIEKLVISHGGPVFGAEIPPRTWHAFAVLSKDASIFEVIEGKYDGRNHKTLASWAPDEADREGAQKYLESLKRLVKMK